jgi:hypothetical protein
MSWRCREPVPGTLPRPLLESTLRQAGFAVSFQAAEGAVMAPFAGRISTGL